MIRWLRSIFRWLHSYFTSKNPLTSRRRFATRGHFAIAVIGGGTLLVIMAIFGLFVWLVPGQWLPMVIVDGICLAVASYLYIAFSDRPVFLECGRCHRIISSKTLWTCGVCGYQNMDVISFPFLHKCGNPKCGIEPKAYRCHHCEKEKITEMIYLSEDHDNKHFASHIRSVAPPPPPSEHAIMMGELRERREQEEVKLEIVKLKGQMTEIRKAAKGDLKKALSIAEILKLKGEAKMKVRLGAKKAMELFEKEHPNDERAKEEFRLIISQMVTEEEGNYE